MKQNLIYLLFIIGLCSCNIPTELAVFEGAKPADKFARQFIDKIINGDLENAFKDINPEKLSDEAREFLTNTTQNINGNHYIKIRIVESGWTSAITSYDGNYTIYRFAYEYEFEKGNILFKIALKEKENNLLINSFTGDFLPAPLSELTKFTFFDKSIVHYIFFSLVILIPIFNILTLIVMLISKIGVKKKVIWFFLIIIFCLPRFVMNWNTGQIDYNILFFNFPGGGAVQPNLYSAWILFFHIPIGAVIYWVKRKSLLPIKEDNNYSNEEPIIDSNLDEKQE